MEIIEKGLVANIDHVNVKERLFVFDTRKTEDKGSARDALYVIYF